jgi:hypothetical protein
MTISFMMEGVRKVMGLARKGYREYRVFLSGVIDLLRHPGISRICAERGQVSLLGKL